MTDIRDSQLVNNLQFKLAEVERTVRELKAELKELKDVNTLVIEKRDEFAERVRKMTSLLKSAYGYVVEQTYVGLTKNLLHEMDEAINESAIQDNQGPLKPGEDPFAPYRDMLAGKATAQERRKHDVHGRDCGCVKLHWDTCPVLRASKVTHDCKHRRVSYDAPEGHQCDDCGITDATATQACQKHAADNPQPGRDVCANDVFKRITRTQPTTPVNRFGEGYCAGCGRHPGDCKNSNGRDRLCPKCPDYVSSNGDSKDG